MKTVLVKFNSRKYITRLFLLFLSGVIMVIENLVFNTNELIAVILYIVALGLSGFPVAVDAVKAVITRRFAYDIPVTVCAFGAFLLDYYQTGVLTLMIYGFLQIVGERVAYYIYNNSRTDCMCIKSDLKRRVRLTDIKKGDRVLVREGACFPFDCTDEIDGNKYEAGSIAEKNTVVVAPSPSVLLPEIELHPSLLDRTRKIAIFAASVVVIVAVATVLIIGLTGGGLTVEVYKIFTAVIVQPYELLFVRSNKKYVPVILFATATAVLDIFAFTGLMSLWLATLIKFTVALYARITVANKVNKV